MELKKTKKQQARETKMQIFTAALELLNEKEFDQIKVRDIVQAAGVSTGTFYNYYDTKLDVFYDTYRMADQYFDETVRYQLTQDSAWDRILYYFDEYARYSCEMTTLALTKVLYNSGNKGFNRPQKRGMRPLLREQVQYGVDRGDIQVDLPVEEITDFLLISARGLVYNWCTRNGDYPLREAMKRYVGRLLMCYKV